MMTPRDLGSGTFAFLDPARGSLAGRSSVPPYWSSPPRTPRLRVRTSAPLGLRYREAPGRRRSKGLRAGCSTLPCVSSPKARSKGLWRFWPGPRCLVTTLSRSYAPTLYDCIFRRRNWIPADPAQVNSAASDVPTSGNRRAWLKLRLPNPIPWEPGFALTPGALP
jgi:hypothetical protein